MKADALGDEQGEARDWGAGEGAGERLKAGNFKIVPSEMTCEYSVRLSEYLEILGNGKVMSAELSKHKWTIV